MGLQAVGASTSAIFTCPVTYKAVKRISGTIILYNPGAANGQIRNNNRAQDWSITTVNATSVYGFGLSGTTSAASAVGDSSFINWTADARL